MADSLPSENRVSVHRHAQLSEWVDRAASERVRCFCNAGKAIGIGNKGAAQWFTERAKQWERIRVLAARRCNT